ncbi:MAG: hypothetical protein A2287_01430 [Candidatus Melainabacteria bacterium RIFOXYA12_FULL_32_12]|nr:MAG: hypothetical protein A2255_10660 [Candidatus Melainabacteria bacterium RIFOXYA2_FULL_32_9]OGI28382.1 MAG: hypothetical protein A2287_01430 [Candidatus Melainabacteria bacterium RIFOXYA12_FULL_32_12]
MYKQGNYKKIIGFTLAEVLITLTIIGIVAALTIPAIIQKVQDTQYKVAFKAAFSDIAAATQEIMLNNGGTMKGICTDGDHTCFRNAYQPFFNSIKSCDNDASFGVCWPEHHRALVGEGAEETYNVSSIVLNNGIALRFCFNNRDCVHPSNTILRCGWVAIDVNGLKNPNRFGKDIFYVHIQENKISPWGAPGDQANRICIAGDISSSNGWGCAAKVLKNENY